MKHIIIAAVAAALSLACVNVAAQTTPAPHNKGAKPVQTQKKPQPSTIQPVVIPKEAVANPDGTYSYTDKAGKKWLYGNTPFGISKVEDTRGMNGGFPTTPVEQLVKSTDNGETVKFERQTPFGPARWERKKSELNDEERRVYEQQHPQRCTATCNRSRSQNSSLNHKCRSRRSAASSLFNLRLRALRAPGDKRRRPRLSLRAQTPPAQPPPAAAPPPAPRVVGAVNFNNQPLLEVINVLAQELHINYILDASVRGGTVTINTYGAGQGVELRPLFETILRMNNLAMVQAGDIFRIVPLANIARQPVQPISQTDPSKVADDERLVLNLVFLRFVTSGEMAKVLAPFIGDGGQLQSYDPANLLIILDNSRNMRRTLELVAMFDSDAFAGQRVRAFEVRNGRPSDIAKELEEIFKAYSLSGGKGNGAVQFLPVDRVSTILAIAPNPGAFAEVEKWIQKLDVTPKAMAGGIQNFVYKLKYGRAEILGSVINQLYGGCSPGIGYGSGYGISGNSSYPSQSYAGVAGNVGGGYGSPYGGNAFNNGTNGGGYGGSQYGGGGYGSSYGGGGYSANCAPAGYSSPYAVTTNNPALGAFGVPASPAPTGAATGLGSTNPSPSTTAASSDQTGSYLSGGAYGGGAFGQPRIVPNPFDNTLIVQSSPEQWEQIKGLLDQLDVSPRQVLIDAKVFEVDLSGSFAAGVEAYLQQKGATNPAGITSTQLLGSSNAAGNATLLLSAGTLVGQSRELLALLTLQETRTRAKVLSAPSVIATDSIPASISCGRFGLQP